MFDGRLVNGFLTGVEEFWPTILHSVSMWNAAERLRALGAAESAYSFGPPLDGTNYGDLFETIDISCHCGLRLTVCKRRRWGLWRAGGYLGKSRVFRAFISYKGRSGGIHSFFNTEEN